VPNTDKLPIIGVASGGTV